MQEGRSVLAEREDAQSDELQFRVSQGSCIGGVVQTAGEVQQVVTGAACVLWDLEKYLVYKGRSYVGHCQGRNCAEDANWEVLDLLLDPA